MNARTSSGVCAFAIEKFQQVDEFGFFPAKFSCHVNGELFYRTEIEVVSINKPIPRETLQVAIPPMTPFVEEHSGKFGIWGDGKPLRYFSTNEEARQWDQNRKQNALKLRNGTNNGVALRYFFALLIFSCVLIYFAVQRRK